MTPQETELLIRIDERVHAFDEKLDLIVTAHNQRFAGVNKRIDGLPQWHHVAAALLTSIVALGAAVIRQFVKGT
jgi:hypothetical protein